MSGTDLLCNGAAPTSTAVAARSGSSDSDGVSTAGGCCFSVMGDEGRMKPGGGGGGTGDGGGGAHEGTVTAAAAAEGRSSWRPPGALIGDMAQPCMLGLLVISAARPVLKARLQGVTCVKDYT